MRFCHLATNEWMTYKELQKKLDDNFDFKCNECKKIIGEHVAVLAEGIFCKPCQLKTLSMLSDLIGDGNLYLIDANESAGNGNYANIGEPK